MIAPFDISWNGTTYLTGEKIPAHETKLIAALGGGSEQAKADPEAEEKPAKRSAK